MNKILPIFITLMLVFGFSSSFSQCNYSIVLFDTFGDGWNGGQVTVTVGTATNGPYTIATGGGPQTYQFPVTIGQAIYVTYTAGNWPEENEYFIYDSDGIEIFHDGPNPTANNTLVGNAICPSCIAPTSLNVTNISVNSVTLGWTSTGSLWNIQYGTSGFPLGTGTIINGLTTNTYNLSGLSASSSYSFYVQNDCGSGNLSSWAGPFTFNTLTCLPANQCAFVMSMHDLGNSWNGAGITVYQNGVNLGFFTVTGGGQNIANVNLCPGSNIQLFWTTGTYDNETSFQMLDPSNNVIFSWNSGGAPPAGLFYTFTASCTPVTCPAPITLTATSITNNSASLNWVEQGSATNWIIEYGPQGFTHGNGTIINATAHPYLLNGLNSNTSYSFYVRSLCSIGDTSFWAGPQPFTTLLSSVSNPSACGLQIHIPDGNCVNIPIVVNGVPGTQLGTDVLLSDFRFIISHTWDGDINATLESPNGAIVQLTQNIGNSGDNFGIINGSCNSFTNFNMTGANGSIGSGTAPFVGSYIPLGNFNTFNDNSNPNGTWILHACDALMTDTGSVQFVQLVFDPIIPPATVLINELDCDQVGNDSLEFVELYDGGVGNYPLDGYTLVFYNGSTDQSYLSFDLDGYTTDSNGYFVIGNSNVTGAAITFTNNLLQNGADAVALYSDDATSFPASTPLTLTNLVDALVYETSDPIDVQLIALLNTGQPQIDENQYNNKDIVSCSRIPNGVGGLRNTNTYKPAVPTPKAMNQPLPNIVWQSSVFNEAFANDGAIANSIHLELNDLTFSSITNFTEGVEFIVANVPAGLSVEIITNTDTTATISLLGNAASHLNINDVNNLTITFNDAAYNGLSSAFVIGNTKNNILIDFMDVPPPTLIWDNNIFNESIINDGSITNTVNIELISETFTISNGNMIPSTHYSASNVPSGLNLQIEVTSDTTATISLIGNATNNNSIDNISNLTIAFQDAIFTGNNAVNVNNYMIDTLNIQYIDPYYQDLYPSIVPNDTIYICNNCAFCSPAIFIHNNGPTPLLQNDSVFVFYQYAPLTSPVIDTIILNNNLLPNDSLLYQPLLNITQTGIYGFSFYIFSDSDNNQFNDTTSSIIYSYNVSVDLGGINDTIVVTNYPYILDAGTGLFPYTYIWSTMSTTQTLNVTVDGWYYVSVTDFNGCVASDSVYIYQNSTILDLSIEISPSDTIYICNNCPCNYPEFLIINHGPNSVYQSDTIIVNYIYSPLFIPVTDTLILNADLISGDTLIYNPILNITELGLSTIQASIYNVNDYAAINDTSMASIYAYQISADLGGINDTLIVNSYPMYLDAGACSSPFGCNYSWSTFDTSQMISVVYDNWYYVTVSDSHGCTAIDSVYVLLNPNTTDLSIEIVPSDSIYICNNCACNYPQFLIINNGPYPLLQNDSILISYLYAPLSAPATEVYMLSTDLLPTDTLIFIPALDISQTGYYPIVAYIYNFNNINATNDTSYSNIFAYSLSVNLGGVNDTITVTDWPLALIGNYAGPYSCTYLWSNSSTQSAIAVMADGWYSITVTDSRGCTASDAVFVYKPQGIHDFSGLNEIKVYPNPAKEIVNVELNMLNKEDVTIYIYSMNGQILKEIKNSNQSVIKESISISDIASGIYYLKIKTEKNIKFVKLVIK